MKYNSFSEITENYLFLRDIINGLGNEHFQYMSDEEVRTEKEKILDEIRLDASFKHLAMFEARVRTDYNRSIASKQKDTLSKEYRTLCDEHRKRTKDYKKPREELCRRVKFEDILKRIKFVLEKTGSETHRDCSAIIGYLGFRHWYAHGRYFTHQPQIPDPEDLEFACSEIINEITNRIMKAKSFG